MDYFLIELVNTVRASSAVAVARTKKVEQEMIDAGLLPAPPPNAAAALPSIRDSVASTGSKPDGKAALDEDEEALRLRLESIGMHVGANVAERYVGIIVLSERMLKLTFWVIGYATTVNSLRTRWTRSNSYVRTCGPLAGTSK